MVVPRFELVHGSELLTPTRSIDDIREERDNVAAIQAKPATRPSWRFATDAETWPGEPVSKRVAHRHRRWRHGTPAGSKHRFAQVARPLAHLSGACSVELHGLEHVCADETPRSRYDPDPMPEVHPNPD